MKKKLDSNVVFLFCNILIKVLHEYDSLYKQCDLATKIWIVDKYDSNLRYIPHFTILDKDGYIIKQGLGLVNGMTDLLRKEVVENVESIL